MLFTTLDAVSFGNMFKEYRSVTTRGDECNPVGVTIDKLLPSAWQPERLMR